MNRYIPPNHLREGYSILNDKEYIISGIEDFIKMQKSINGTNILEIGCCTGRVLRHFSDAVINHDWNVTGLDMVPEYIDWGKKNLPWFDWTVNTNKKYDFIYAQSVMTHVSKPEPMLEYVFNHLNPNGVAFLTIHDHISIENIRKHRDNHLSAFCQQRINIDDFKFSKKIVLGEELGRHCKVFYERNYFVELCESKKLFLQDVVERAHRNDQTGVVLKRINSGNEHEDKIHKRIRLF